MDSPPQPSASAEKPAATQKLAKVFKNIPRMLRLGSTTKSTEPAEAPIQDPPATANSLGYVATTSPTTPFNPAFETIPEGKEARCPPKREAYVLQHQGPQPNYSSNARGTRSQSIRNHAPTPNSIRSRITATPASAKTYGSEAVPRALAGKLPRAGKFRLPPEPTIQKSGFTNIIARIFDRGST